jgi:hypothetical protein
MINFYDEWVYFAKGKIGSLDYRFSVTNPLHVQTESTAPKVAITPTMLPIAAAKDVANNECFQPKHLN